MPSSYVSVLLIVGASLLFELPLIWYFQENSRFFIRYIFIGGTLLGLLLLSPVARYFGALFFGLSAGYTVWSAISSKAAVAPIITLLIGTSAILQIIAAYMLVFSKSFANEFSMRRAEAPPPLNIFAEPSGGWSRSMRSI